MKYYNNIGIALMQSVAEIGTKSTMKSSKKTLPKLSPHTPQKTPKGNSSSSTKEMLHTDIIVKAPRTRVGSILAREATIYHQNIKAINQLNCHMRQPAPILQSEGIVVLDRLNRRRAKHSLSAEVRIKYAMLSSQCKTAREWETSGSYTRNIGVSASTCNRHINNKKTVWSHEV
jgi:hypothetical protein